MFVQGFVDFKMVIEPFAGDCRTQVLPGRPNQKCRLEPLLLRRSGFRWGLGR
jgi:hypothetical protein